MKRVTKLRLILIWSIVLFVLFLASGKAPMPGVKNLELFLPPSVPVNNAAPVAIAQPAPVAVEEKISAADTIIQNAFDRRLSKLQVQGKAVVYRIPPDDLKGSRHQKFLLRLSTGLSLLIAHNIDLAPRINNIQVGDTVEFYGVYEWNDKGGVVHWTHRDPARRHVDGWLWHDGRTYQ